MGSNKQSLLYMLNALKFTFLDGNSTRIDKIEDQDWLSITFDQPFWVICYITAGSLYIETDEAHYKVEPGQGLIIPAHTKYKIKPLEQEFVTHWLNVNLHIYEHLDFFHFIQAPYVTSVSVGAEFARLHEDIKNLINQEQAGVQESLMTMLQLNRQLFSLLELILSLPHIKLSSFEEIGKFERFRSVLSHIEHHLADKIKVPPLAKLMYLSTSHFYREFQEAFQVPPMQYIAEQRLKKAQYLLATTELTIKEIGERVGYDNAYSFNRFFKSMYGESPGHYRTTARSSFHSKFH